jgi:hypothetical protein
MRSIAMNFPSGDHDASLSHAALAVTGRWVNEVGRDSSRFHSETVTIAPAASTRIAPTRIGTRKRRERVSPSAGTAACAPASISAFSSSNSLRRSSAVW